MRYSIISFVLFERSDKVRMMAGDRIYSFWKRFVLREMVVLVANTKTGIFKTFLAQVSRFLNDSEH